MSFLNSFTLRVLSTGLLVALSTTLSSCLTLSQYGRIYFEKNSSTPSVASASDFLTEYDASQKVRETLYGPSKASEIFQCILFRNQLWMAAKEADGSQAGRKVKEAAQALERAYQQSDQEFLHVCREYVSSEVGKVFLSVQNEYLSQ